MDTSLAPAYAAVFMHETKLRSVEQRTQTVCLLVLSAVAIGVALFFLRQVLVPFVLALFLTMAVTPVMDLLHHRMRMPRGLSIATTIGLASVGLLAMGVLVSTALSEVLAKDAIYVEQVNGLVSAAEERLVSWQGSFESVLGVDEGPVPSDAAAPALDDPLAVIPEQGIEPNSADGEQARVESPFGALRGKLPTMVGQAISWTVNSALALLSQGLLVMIFMMFLITGYKAPEQRDPDSLNFKLRAQVKEYLRVKILVSGITGTATFAILQFLGVDLALVFGLMAFFLNFIPNIGSGIAVLLPLPVVVLAPEADLAPLSKLLAIALPGLVQFLVGNVMEPRWLGKSLDLSPVVVLLSLIFWGVLWGPVGMLLSVPITAVIKMLLERSELTRPVASLLSDGD